MAKPEEQKPALRRFYKSASSAPVEARVGFAVLLDGRKIKTPAKNQFFVPTDQLAQAIAVEWDGQGEVILPETMPLMQIAGTAIDKVSPASAETQAATLEYAKTDLLCYRADSPADLVELQRTQWQPVLDWIARDHDAPLHSTTSIMALEQPQESIDALASRLEGFDPFALTAFNLLTTSLGSIVLAFAVNDGERSPKAAWEAAFLDETWQAQHWGEDEEATQRRAVALADIECAHRFLTLLT